MRYDYDFLYLLQTTIIHLRMIARAGQPIIAHRVIDELALYLIVEESRSYLELTAGDYDFLQLADDWSEWIFDLFDDEDILSFLYANVYLPSDHPYHFDHWIEEQFYIDR